MRQVALLRKRFARLLLACCAMLAPLSSSLAAIAVVDDANHTVTLAKPARRIVTLAPHAAELVHAAGAGAFLAGVSDYSSFPPEVKRIPSVGGVAALDLERVVALKPDLVVVWSSGNSAAQISKLRSLGIPVFESEPRSFDAIASSLERLAQLAGTDATGRAAAASFRDRLQKIEATYRDRPRVTVFYQIWRTPLMTLNGAHLVSTAIALCGGQNIFAQLPQLAPVVSTEAVLKSNPEVIITSSEARDDQFSGWRRFPSLAAVANDNLFQLDGELMNRASPRVLDGTEALCKLLDTARGKR